MSRELSIGLLAAVTVGSAAAASLGSPAPVDSAPLLPLGSWTIALGAAFAAACLSLEPRPETGLSAISPVLGGAVGVLVVLVAPSAIGASLAALPLALCAYLRLSEDLRDAVAEAPAELWETAWLLGASRMQTVLHVVLPSAVGLRSRLTRALGEIGLGAGLLFVATGLFA